jgi:hypothetical protein
MFRLNLANGHKARFAFLGLSLKGIGINGRASFVFFKL